MTTRKKAVIAASLVLLTSLAASHSEHTTLPDPGVTPDSALFAFDQMEESISLAFAGNKSKKAEMKLDFAMERLSEAKELSSKNRSESTVKALNMYQSQISEAENMSKELPEEARINIVDFKARNQEVLSEVMSKVPEEAQKGLQTALKHSKVNAGQKKPSMKPENTGNQGYRATGKVIITH